MKKLMRNKRIIPFDLLLRIESSNVPLEDIKIDALDLSTRSYKRLRKRGIDNIHELVCLTDFNLRKIPGIGDKSLQEIVRNTNIYLEEIAKSHEAEQLFTISLLGLIKASNAHVHSTVIDSSANQNLYRQLLEPIPIHKVITDDNFLEWLMHLGLSSSLDIWILAFVHYFKIDRKFGEALKQISQSLRSKWHTKKMVDFHTDITAIYKSDSAKTATDLSMTTTGERSPFAFLKVELVIKYSNTGKVHWKALLPYQYLNQRIAWFRDDDKSTGLCTFLKRVADNRVVHWTDPPAENWERLPRSRAVDAFYDWLSLVERTFSKRDYEIIKHRFGLVSGERTTLQQVGNVHNVTRERVRQVVDRSLKSLLHPARKRYLTPFISHFDVVFEKHGGIMTLNEIVNSSAFFTEFIGLSWLQVAELILIGCKKYSALDHNPVKDTLNEADIRWVTWHLREIDPVLIRSARETAKHLIGTYPLRYDNDDMVDMVTNIIKVDRKIVWASLRTMIL